MVDAYFRWRYPDCPSVDLDEVHDPCTQQQSSPTSDPAATSPSTSAEVEILVIDIYNLSTSVKISCADDLTTAATLVGLGFIGNAPFRPSVAVSIKTLELYRVLRRRKPSFSIEAFVKVVCDLYMVCVFFIIYSARSHQLKGSIPSQVPPFIFRRVSHVPGSHPIC